MAEPTGNMGAGSERPRRTEFPGTVPDRPEDPAGYKPLALFAILGLIASATYGVFLAIGVLISLITRSPMLASGFSLLWPIAGLILSLMGWVQVRRSEGTREGGRLAFWGIVLSLLFGLGYSAYFVGGSLAINQLSDPYVMRWFDMLKNGKVEEAFIETLPPEQRPSTANKSQEALREELAARFNSSSEPGRRGPGPLGMFNQSDLVRFLGQGGSEVKIVSLGVKESKYENNGYNIQHLYRITTPVAEFEAIVTVFGVEKKGGWVWTVRANPDSGVLTNTIQPTALGQRMGAVNLSATNFVQLWVRALASGQMADAFAMTRDPAERAKIIPPPANLEELEGFKEFRAGGLVKAEPGIFTAPAKFKDEIPKVLRQCFGQPESFRPLIAKPTKGQTLLTFQPQGKAFRWKQTGDRLRAWVDLEMSYMTFNEPTGGLVPKYTIEGSLILEAPAAVVDDASLTPWQIVGLELRQGGEPPPMMGPGAGQ